MRHRGLYQALLDPACYPERPRRVFARDTHISRLYFTPRYVYKLKKPVDFGFLDFTSLDRRRFFCDEEVRLNRRFAPDTYLGTVTIRRDGNRYRVSSNRGEVIEYAVKMRRLPRAQMLDRKIRRHADELKDDIDRLTAVISHLLDDSLPVDDLSPEQLFRSLAYNCEENLDQTRAIDATLLDRRAWEQVALYTRSALHPQGLMPLLLQRASVGLVREGHGDLHSEHICLSDPIRIYDCIEFNRRFRINDLLSELAFLLMDLDFRGRPDLAQRLYSGCRSSCQGLDVPQVLLFFKVYRAWVRGKVAALTSLDPHLDDKAVTKAQEAARRYFALALHYLCKPSLIITCGLMGSGKSTFAAALTSLSGAQLHRSDVARKTLLGRDASQHDAAAFGEGIYSSEHTANTYDELLKRSEGALRTGNAVVVDAAFGDAAQRERFRKLAEELNVPFVIALLEARKGELLSRLKQRWSYGGDISDGRAELLDTQMKSFDYPKDDEIIEKIDSSREVDYNVQLVLGRLLIDHGWRA